MLKMIKAIIGVFLFFIFSSTSFADENFVERQDVQAFINHMVHRYHFNKAELTALFANVKLRPQVIQHIKKPLEKQPWYAYQMLFVNEWRIKHGVEFWNKHEKELNQAEEVYGVPAGIIVATLGVETKYGQKMGEYRVIDSLSNLAFNHSPRAKFFLQELEEFLLLTRTQRLDPLKILGSYAGAIGQPQFMPSSYRYYAVNFSNSGQIDLIHNDVDVIGSVANYYKKHGWNSHQPITTQASIIGNRYQYLLHTKNINSALPFNDLAKYGIVPQHHIHDNYLGRVKIIELQGRYNKEYWLGFPNFEVIKRYNPSELYAMAVYQLGYYITVLKEKSVHG